MTVLARLDPRSKLAAQAGLATAAFVHTTPTGLAVVTAVVAAGVALAERSTVALLRPYRFLLPFLVAGPLFALVRLRPPWIEPSAAVDPLLASYRTGLLVALGGLYVTTTPVRESEAALAWLVPGRFGRLLALGVGLVFRFLPLVRRELRTTKAAMNVRLGTERPLTDRIRLLVERAVVRLFDRADRLAVAMRARCLSWNPTYPPLAFSWRDLPVLALALAAFAWACVPFVGLLAGFIGSLAGVAGSVGPLATFAGSLAV